MLVPRGIFNDHLNGDGHHSHHINHTCPIPDELGPPITPVLSNMTFHHIALIAAGAMMGFACLLSFGLILGHALHFSVPMEQKQIIRITLTIPVFAIVSFLTVLLESQAVYLTPLTDLYEAWALAGFFLLLCAYISADAEAREQTLHGQGKQGVYNRAWFFVFQQPVIMTILVVAQEITQAAGVYCATSRKVEFAQVWISSFNAFTSACAITAVLRFYGATKQMYTQQRPLLKLISFKSIVFLSFVQSVLFSFLTSSGHLKANNHLTFQNFAVDIPALITCGEMVVFSILFLFAYPIKLYVAKRDNASGIGAQYLGGILGIKALLAAFNIFDLLRAIWVAPLRLKSGRTLLEEEKVDYSSEEPSRLTQDVDVTYQ